MTHHAPSIQSIVDHYWSDPVSAVSAAFASNLDKLILGYQMRIWIHGHTHESFDYRIVKTRVVRDPRATSQQNKTGGSGRITRWRYLEIRYPMEAEEII